MVCPSLIFSFPTSSPLALSSYLCFALSSYLCLALSSSLPSPLSLPLSLKGCSDRVWSLPWLCLCGHEYQSGSGDGSGVLQRHHLLRPRDTCVLWHAMQTWSMHPAAQDVRASSIQCKHPPCTAFYRDFKAISHTPRYIICLSCAPPQAAGRAALVQPKENQVFMPPTTTNALLAKAPSTSVYLPLYPPPPPLMERTNGSHCLVVPSSFSFPLSSREAPAFPQVPPSTHATVPPQDRPTSGPKEQTRVEKVGSCCYTARQPANSGHCLRQPPHSCGHSA